MCLNVFMAAIPVARAHLTMVIPWQVTRQSRNRAGMADRRTGLGSSVAWLLVQFDCPGARWQGTSASHSNPNPELAFVNDIGQRGWLHHILQGCWQRQPSLTRPVELRLHRGG
jgi:hypothetical protein